MSRHAAWLIVLLIAVAVRPGAAASDQEGEPPESEQTDAGSGASQPGAAPTQGGFQRTAVAQVSAPP